ncbi:hypothetical protein IWX88_002605 [Frigoribacterium sp. CG_9.8]|nr:hypothetical protein [Frigoribacterium sp. CG_9.8]
MHAFWRRRREHVGQVLGEELENVRPVRVVTVDVDDGLESTVLGGGIPAKGAGRIGPGGVPLRSDGDDGGSPSPAQFR